MKHESEFSGKLDALVRSIPPSGREQVSTLVSSVVHSGGTSERTLLEMLRNQHLDPTLRLDMCWLVPRLGITDAAGVLEELMYDPSEQMRMEAASGLGLVPDDDAVEALLAALDNDVSKPVRQAVLHALGIRSSPRSAPRLLDVLQDRDDDAEVRADAAEALAHVKHERILPALIQSLRDESALVRYSAAYALGQQRDARALPPLRDLATHDHTSTPWGTVASRALLSIEIVTSTDEA